jgi:thiamine biosynthesis lipoprotein
MQSSFSSGTNSASKRAVAVVRGKDCWRGTFHAMASPCELLCKADSAAETERLTQLAATEVWRIEDKFSRYLPDNIIARINNAAGATVRVDPETAQLLDFATTLFDLSEGKFDITSGVLRRVWRFDGGNDLPSEAAVNDVLQLVGWQRATWSAPNLCLQPGMEIDLGGIGKEYAVDCATAILRDETELSCLINLGGDLAVSRRISDKQSWNVGIEATGAQANVPAGLLNLHVGALATSGDARRFLVKDDIRYSHILDARNGWPVADAPRSITVAADTCTQAGMLSTLGMLEGSGAEAFLDAQDVKFWCSR